jgi:integrase
MGRRASGSPPQIRNHNGYARVRWNGQDIHLGRYGSPEAQTKYTAIVRHWLEHHPASHAEPAGLPATPEPDQPAIDAPIAPPSAPQATSAPPEAVEPPEGITIVELCDRYIRFAERYYRLPDGSHTSGLHTARMAVKPLLRLGDLAAADYGPKALRRLMEELEQEPSRHKDKSGRALPAFRTTINAKVKAIWRIFKWAASEELLDVTVYQKLKTVQLLQMGRTIARESVSVKPVSNDVFEQTLKHLPSLPADILRCHALIGCRPGDICKIRPCEIIKRDRPDGVWVWRVSDHKNSFRGQECLYPIGPQCQAILAPYLSRPSHEYCFQSAEGERLRNATRRQGRKSPMTPSHRARREKARRKKQSVEHYTVAALRRAIKRVCERHGIPHWHPHQVRHKVCTDTRDEYGPEYAQARLAHKSIKVTEIYARVSFEKAAVVARERG